MKRLVVRALVVLGSVLVALAVLEVGYRALLAARGEAHSSAARRAGYVGQLDWILRPHGPIAMGALEFEEAAEDDLMTPMQSTVLSPFIGVDRVALLEGYEAGGRYFASGEGERTFDVVLLGGSVAANLGADEPARRELERIVASDPRLGGRPVRVHAQGRAGFKAPQTSILCDLLFQLGWRPDLVVLLDGFNEVALANQNRRLGAHPIYPSIPAWAHVAPEVDAAASDIDRLVEMQLARDETRGLLELTIRGGLYRSAIASRVMDALVSRPTARHARALRSLELRRGDESMPLALRGPEPPADLAAGVDAMLRVWFESSTSLDAACDARRTPFLHVLQPTLFDPGAKPITENERRRCQISDEWLEGVVQGYPRLREQGAELLARGVEFRDASRMFAEYEGDLYYDSCHVTPVGSLEIARFIGARVIELDRLIPGD